MKKARFVCFLWGEEDFINLKQKKELNQSEITVTKIIFNQTKLIY